MLQSGQHDPLHNGEYYCRVNNTSVYYYMKVGKYHARCLSTARQCTVSFSFVRCYCVQVYYCIDVIQIQPLWVVENKENAGCTQHQSPQDKKKRQQIVCILYASSETNEPSCIIIGKPKNKRARKRKTTTCLLAIIYSIIIYSSLLSSFKLKEELNFKQHHNRRLHANKSCYAGFCYVNTGMFYFYSREKKGIIYYILLIFAGYV